MSEGIERLNELKEYIDDSLTNLRAIESKPDMGDDEKLQLVYEVYANFLDLKDECLHILRGFRYKFKIKDTAVKKWLADHPKEGDEDPEDHKEEAQAPSGPPA